MRPARASVMEAGPAFALCCRRFGAPPVITIRNPWPDPAHWKSSGSGIVWGSTIERTHGLKPNYQYEKRQREMEKKKKKAEKEHKKAAPTETPEVETPPATEAAVPPAEQ